MLLIPVAPHASLPETVRAWVPFLREKLGNDTPLLLVFDRAGAFPGLWKWLRDNGVHFVTYQRAKYRKFRREWFRRQGRPMTLRESDGEKLKVMVQGGQMNLGAERGRVRRIRILLPDNVQINVVASSTQSAQWLCRTLFTRWRQENAFRHGVERWGINQLDGRQVEDVPAGTMVTNPRRIDLDKLLAEAREREKKLRLQLQQIYPGHPDRPALKRALADNRANQREVVKTRRQTPKKVPIEATDLQGELKQHTREYKVLVDIWWEIRQDVKFPVAITRRLLKLQGNTAGEERVPGVIPQLHLLFPNLGAVDGAAATKTADRFPRHIDAVVPDDEEPLSTGDAEEQGAGAEVAVSDPHVPRRDLRQHRFSERALLGVAILARDHIGYLQEARIQHDQCKPWQRARCGLAQLGNPMLRGRQVIPVEDPSSIPWKEFRKRCLHAFDQRNSATGDVLDQCRTDPRLDSVDLVVQRLYRDLNSAPIGLIGGVKRRPDAVNHEAHQVDDCGEQQRPRVLRFSARAKHGINIFGAQRMLECPTRHHANRALFNERSEHLAKNHALAFRRAPRFGRAQERPDPWQILRTRKMSRNCRRSLSGLQAYRKEQWIKRS